MSGEVEPQIHLPELEQAPKYETAAIIDKVRPLLGIIRDELNENYESELTPSQIRRSIEDRNYSPKPAAELSRIVTSLYEQQVDCEIPEEFVAYLTEEHELVKADQLADGIAKIDGGSRIIEQRASDVIKFVEYMITDSSSAYALTKALAEHHNKIGTSIDHHLLKQLIAAGSQFESEDLYLRLQHELVDGEFDFQIAQEILVANSEVLGDDESGSYEVRKMIELARLMSASSGDELTIINRLCQPDAVQNWPQEARKLFDARKDQLEQNLLRERQSTIEYLYSRGYILEGSDEKSLERFLHRHPEFTKAPKRLTKLEEVQRSAEQRRKRTSGSKRSMGKTAVKSVERDVPLAEREPLREVKFRTKHGSVYDEDSDEFKAMVADYTNGHENGELETAIKSAITFLKVVDLGSTQRRCIKILTDVKLKFAAEEGQIAHRVYRFRPDQAIGVDLKSKVASKMRIYYVLDKNDNNAINIIDIRDKDESLGFFKKFGLRTSSRK